MRIYLLLLCFIFHSFAMMGQTKAKFIDINYSSFDVENIPYTIESVELHSTFKDTLGFVSSKTVSVPYPLIAVKEFDNSILSFLNQRFKSPKQEPKIILQIRTLKVAPVSANSFSAKDTFLFECHFILKNKERETLYTYKAKNDVGLLEEPEKIMENYISRALISAVHQFTKSFLRNPDWIDENASSSFKVKAKVYHNDIKDRDTLTCEKGKKLKAEDFKRILPKDSLVSDAVSRLMLSYKITSEETSKGIELKIYTKAYFDKNKSWKKAIIINPNWLEYEQGYFDICCEYGYKLRDSAMKHEYSIGEFKSELNKIYNTILAEYNTAIKVYAEKKKDY